MPKATGGSFEITGKNGPALQRFYSELFDWSIDDAGDGSECGLVDAGEKGIAGGIGGSQIAGEGGDPAPFLVKAEQLGGTAIVPSTDIPSFGLAYAFFADSDGHVHGLSKGAGR